MHSLAHLQLKRDRVEDAAALGLRAGTSKDSSIAADALYCVGVDLVRRGHVREGYVLLTRAVEVAPSELVPHSRFHLAQAQAELGHPREAVSLYRSVADSNSAEYASRALIDLGRLLRDSQRPRAARAVFSRAFDREDGEWAALAGYLLGLLDLEEDPSAAWATWSRVAQWETTQYGTRALRMLAARAAHSGDSDSAAGLLERCLSSSHSEEAACAAVDLAALRAGQHRTEESVQLYERALASGVPDAVAVAGLRLGWQNADSDAERALELFERSSRSGTSDHAFNAASSAAHLLANLGRNDEAIAYCGDILAHGPVWTKRRGLVLLAQLVFYREDPEARRVFYEYEASVDPQLRDLASFLRASIAHDGLLAMSAFDCLSASDRALCAQLFHDLGHAILATSPAASARIMRATCETPDDPERVDRFRMCVIQAFPCAVPVGAARAQWAESYGRRRDGVDVSEALRSSNPVGASLEDADRGRPQAALSGEASEQ